MIRKGDVIFATIAGTSFVGHVNRFWEYNESIVVCVASYRRVRPNDDRFWFCGSPEIVFVAGDSVVDAMPWRVDDDSDERVVRVIPPFVRA